MATAAATLAAIAIGALALAALVLAFYVAIPIALFRMALELTPRRAA